MMPAMPLWRLIQISNASAIAATDAPRSELKTPAGTARMIERDFVRRDVRGGMLAAGGQIDEPRSHVRELQEIADEP